MARWQFQDFCKENPRNNEEFRRIVEKMITTEEKTRERFLDRNNRDNPDKQNHRNIRHQERKRGQDNTIAGADKSRKFSKSRKYDDIENMHCILHPKGNHTIGNWEDLQRVFCENFAGIITHPITHAELKGLK